MTITYTFHYRFFPKQWSAPSPPDEVDDMHTTLIYRQLVAVYLREWLYVLNSWRMAIRYGMPLLLLAYFLGIVGCMTFLTLLVIVGMLSILIWAKIRAYHSVVAMIEIVIDEVIAANFGFKPTKILED